MSDVVDRLKKSMDEALPPHFDDVEDAIAEIERLRVLIVNECRMAEEASGEAQRWALEVERLREALEGLIDGVVPEVNEKGAGGFLLARLTDARNALKQSPLRAQR